MNLFNQRIPFDIQSPHTAEATTEKLLSLQTANKRTTVRTFEHSGVPRVNIDRVMGRNLGISLSATPAQEGEQTQVKDTVGLASSTVLFMLIFIGFLLYMSLMTLLVAVFGEPSALAMFLFYPAFILVIFSLVRRALKECPRLLSDVHEALGVDT